MGDIYWGKDLAHYLAENTRILQMFNSEDTSVGTWLAGIKVNRKHDSRFDTEWKSRGCCNQFLVTHEQTQADMTVE